MNNIAYYTLKLLSKKQKFLIFISILFAIVVSSLEIIGLGSIALFVSLIVDINLLLEKIPFEKLSNFLKNLNNKEIIYYFSYFLILIFIFKSIILILFNWLIAKILSLCQHVIKYYSRRILQGLFRIILYKLPCQ